MTKTLKEMMEEQNTPLSKEEIVQRENVQYIWRREMGMSETDFLTGSNDQWKFWVALFNDGRGY